MLYKISDINTDWIYEHGITRGVDVGFHCMQDMFSIKRGYPLFVMAAPTAGKSEFTLEVLINLSKFYGWKHFLYSPETGSADELAGELCAKYIGRDFYATYNNQMTNVEQFKAKEFLEKHFVIFDAPRVTVAEFYQEVDKAEKTLNIKFDTVTIDPWNKVKHEKAGRRDDEYLEDVLNDIVENAKKHDRVNIITQHCRDQQPTNKTGFSYLPPPTARDYASGQVWFRMGFMMLGLWRPPKDIVIEGVTYEDNALIVEVHKAKPNGIATQGYYNRKVTLHYDPKAHKYYEHLATTSSYAIKRREEIRIEKPQQMGVRP